MSRWLTATNCSERSSSSVEPLDVEIVDRQEVLHADHLRPLAPLVAVPRRRAPQLDAVVAAVDLREAHADVLAAAGGQVLADEVGADRQLPVAAVDEDRELHRAGTAELGERVHRGAHGAAGEEHVVDEHDHLAARCRRGSRWGRPA